MAIRIIKKYSANSQQLVPVATKITYAWHENCQKCFDMTGIFTWIDT